MEKFLKTYSNVPNGFIEDFFNISKESYDDNDLVISFDNVVRWLNVRKDSIKRLLIKYFVAGLDYITNKKIKYNDNRGASYIDEIYITPDLGQILMRESHQYLAKIRF